ncbi:MAG: helix-turn-helix transcriptional regulator [Steroidobacteraceae bacterium]
MESQPSSTTSAKVYSHSFEIVRPSPLRGGTPIDEFVKDWEADPEMAAELQRARTRLAKHLDKAETLRSLRLKAGLSQALLAARAGTTQSHVALIESGAKDPQTDMITRLAAALELDPARVFLAVRTQRVARQVSDG